MNDWRYWIYWRPARIECAGPPDLSGKNLSWSMERMNLRIWPHDRERAKAGVGETSPNGSEYTRGRRCQTMGVLRHLCLLGFNLFLDDYLVGDGSSESVREAIGRLVMAKDQGLTVFLEVTCPDSVVLRPSDSNYQVHYLMAHSLRLQELLRILDLEGASLKIRIQALGS